MSARTELALDVFDVFGYAVLVVGAVMFVVGVIIKWPWGFVGALIALIALSIVRMVWISVLDWQDSR